MNKQIRDINFSFQKATLLFVALLFSSLAFSQAKKEKNLVPNPSFETHKNKANSITNAVPWMNIGTVDYYLKPDKKDTSKFKGAHSGKCFGGLRFQPDYKEYMYVQLLTPLQKGKTYEFRMFVRLLGQSTVTVKQLGVYFSDDVFRLGMSFDEEGLIDSTYKKGLSGKGWLPIQGNYLARGGEKYIIIGNFKTRMKEDMVRVHKGDIFEMREAYYFIDDISVFEKIAPVDPNAQKAPGNWVSDFFDNGQTFIIKDLQFEKGTANLLQSSYNSLDDLVKFLKDHPQVEIQLNGHTEKYGNESDEHMLSKSRAKAVVDYLKQHGVINSIGFKGLGSSQPIAPNDSEEYRIMNRRVEVVILKN